MNNISHNFVALKTDLYV